MRSSRIAVTLAVSLALAACVEAESNAEIGTEKGEAPTGEVGRLRGLVIDDSLIPISGANVTISDTALRAHTTPEGLFQFSGVPVGERLVVVEAPGFASASKAVTIVAESTAFVEVTIQHVASEVGYHHIATGRGILACGVTYRQGMTNAGVQGVVTVGAFLGASCNVLNGTGVDVSTFFTWLPDNMSAWRGGAAETEWRSTQALGNGLVQDWAVIGCANNRNATFGRDTGSSPLRNVLGSFELDYRLEDLPNASCNGKDRCNPKYGCHMINRIFSWPSTQAEDAPLDVGVTIQQTFVTYVSSFFRAEPPPDFSALLDA